MASPKMGRTGRSGRPWLPPTYLRLPFRIACSRQPPAPIPRRPPAPSRAEPPSAFLPNACSGWWRPIASSDTWRSILDPLGLVKRTGPELALSAYGLEDADLDLVFSSESVPGPDRTTLRDLIELFGETYCRKLGVELAHLNEMELRGWLQTRMETTRNRVKLTRADRLHLLQQVIGAEVFEQFLQNKFIGAKRFSLEGAESLIPLLQRLIERAARSNVVEIVIGMAHRGRLNVLANVLGKPASQIFAEFQDKVDKNDGADRGESNGGGDVKYHLGYSIDRVFGEGADEHRVHLSLAFNPSHLEWVNTVVLGRVRAKQDRISDSGRTRCLPILIHGDAAFAGQGIVAETLNLSELEGYRVGGTVHIVVNNQVGFTTSPRDAKSCTYATDVARMLQIPIFHVNGEDPEAVCQAVDLAVDFRQRFQRDVLIELWSYRKLGHNEGDEPSYTQPVMYRQIAKKSSIRMAYLAHDAANPSPEGEPAITVEETDAIAAAKRHELEAELAIANGLPAPPRPSTFAGAWSKVKGGPDALVPDAPTAITPAVVKEVTKTLSTVPPGFIVHPKLKSFVLEGRAAMGAGDKPIDWGMGEALAFGSLLTQGVRVRLSGQDSRRGTFSHRHSVLYDYNDGHRLHAARAPARKAGGVRGAGQPALRGRRAGVRVRLQPRHARRAHALGGAVRGLREHRPGHHRPVHRLLGGEVESGERSRAAPAARQRRAGARTLERASRAVPHHGGERQHSSLQPHHAGAVLPRAAAAGAATVSQAAGHHVAQEPAAFAGGDLEADRLHRRDVPADHPDDLHQRPATKSGGFCSARGKVYYDLVAAREEHGYDDVAIVRVEQLYPLRKEELLADPVELSPAGHRWSGCRRSRRTWAPGRYVNRELPPLLAGQFPWSCVSRPLSASPATGLGQAARARAGASWWPKRIGKEATHDADHSGPRARRIRSRGDARRGGSTRGGRGQRRRAARRDGDRQGDAGGPLARRRCRCQDPAQDRRNRGRRRCASPRSSQLAPPPQGRAERCRRSGEVRPTAAAPCGAAPVGPPRDGRSGLAAEEVRAAAAAVAISKQDVDRTLEHHAGTRCLSAPVAAPLERPPPAAAGTSCRVDAASGWCRCRRCGKTIARAAGRGAAHRRAS